MLDILLAPPDHAPRFSTSSATSRLNLCGPPLAGPKVIQHPGLVSLNLPVPFMINPSTKLSSGTPSGYLLSLAAETLTDTETILVMRKEAVVWGLLSLWSGWLCGWGSLPGAIQDVPRRLPCPAILRLKS